MFFHSSVQLFSVCFTDQIFEKLKQEIGAQDADQLKVLGGGKIQVDFEKKQMNVFGESQVISFSTILDID